jgi:hypothetical protein
MRSSSNVIHGVLTQAIVPTPDVQAGFSSLCAEHAFGAYSVYKQWHM